MIVNPIVCCTIQIKNGIMKHVNVSVIIIVHAKMIIVRILPRAFVGMFSVKVLLILLYLRAVKL